MDTCSCSPCPEEVFVECSCPIKQFLCKQCANKHILKNLGCLFTPILVAKRRETQQISQFVLELQKKSIQQVHEISLRLKIILTEALKEANSLIKRIQDSFILNESSDYSEIIKIHQENRLEAKIYTQFQQLFHEAQNRNLSVNENISQINLQERRPETFIDEVNKLTSSISILEEQLTSYQNQIKDSEKINKLLTEQIKIKEDEINSISANLANKDGELKTVTENLSEQIKSKDTEIISMKATAAELKAISDKLSEQINAKDMEINIIKASKAAELKALSDELRTSYFRNNYQSLKQHNKPIFTKEGLFSYSVQKGFQQPQPLNSEHLQIFQLGKLISISIHDLEIRLERLSEFDLIITSSQQRILNRVKTCNTDDRGEILDEIMKKVQELEQKYQRTQGKKDRVAEEIKSNESRKAHGRIPSNPEFSSNVPYGWGKNSNLSYGLQARSTTQIEGKYANSGSFYDENTRIIQSVLQMIVHLPIDISIFSGQTSLHTGLFNVLKGMRNQKADEVDRLLREFVKALNNHSDFKPASQSDLKYLIVFLFRLCPDIITWKRAVKFEHSESGCSEKSHRVDFPEQIIQIFSVIGTQSRGCKLQAETLRSTIFECAKDLVKGYCDKCNTEVYGIKTITSIVKAKVLIFSNEIGISIQIPNIERILVENFEYKLYCIIKMIDCIRNAYNYCVCKEDEGWVEYSGSNKRRVANMEIHNSYILIYAQV